MNHNFFVDAQHWKDESKLPPLYIQQQVQKLRMLMVNAFFNIHCYNQHEDEKVDEEEDASFTFYCQVCHEPTLYYRKPLPGYAVPLCLSGPCLTEYVYAQGEHYLADEVDEHPCNVSLDVHGAGDHREEEKTPHQWAYEEEEEYDSYDKLL